jgi:thioredoxin 1
MASDLVKVLNDSSFTTETSKGMWLVDFWAPWCGPCQMQGPIIDKVAATLKDKAFVAKVNVDEAPTTSAKMGVRSIPTIVVLKDGKEINRFVGLQKETALVTAIEQMTQA